MKSNKKPYIIGNIPLFDPCINCIIKANCSEMCRDKIRYDITKDIEEDIKKNSSKIIRFKHLEKRK